MCKVVYLTGAGGLLGRDFAKRLCSDGYRVVLADIKYDVVSTLSEDLNRAYGSGRTWPVQVDLLDEQQILNSLSLSLQRFSEIDILINNAYPRNKNYGRKLFDVDIKDFNENISMNIGAVFLASKIFSQYFLKRGSGNIINIGSIYGVVAPKFEIYDGTNMTMPVEYAAIKSAVVHLTKYFSVYLRNKNIRVNCVSPGGIEDNQPESFLRQYKEHCINKGMLSPADIYGAVEFLISDKSSFINGQNIIVDDGFSIK